MMTGKLGKRRFSEVEKKEKQSETEKVNAPKDNKCQATQTEIVENSENKETKPNDNNDANVNVSNDKLNEEEDEFYIPPHVHHRLEVLRKAFRYKFLWTHQRKDWKLEKLRQIWFLDNIMNDLRIDDDIFYDVVEYLINCKGRVREVLIGKIMRFIRRLKAEKNEEVKAEVMNSVTYKRTQQILEVLKNKKLV